eukprot:g24703.t1
MPKGQAVLPCATCGGACRAGSCISELQAADEWSIFRRGGSIQWLDIPGTIPGQGDENVLKGFLLNYVIGKGVVSIVLDYCVRDAVRCFVCQFNFQDVEHSCCMRELSEARERHHIDVKSLLNHQTNNQPCFSLRLSSACYVTPRRNGKEKSNKAGKTRPAIGLRRLELGGVTFNTPRPEKAITPKRTSKRQQTESHVRFKKSYRRERRVVDESFFKRHRTIDRDRRGGTLTRNASNTQ